MNIENTRIGPNHGNADGSMDRAQAIVHEIRRHIADDAIDKTALDFGCGTGCVGLPLMDRFRSMLFLDASSDRIMEVERKLSRLHTHRATALCHDIMTMKPLNMKYDYIIASLVLHQIEDTNAVLTHMHQMLHEDGHLIIVDFDENEEYYANFPRFVGHKGFAHADMIDRLMKIGFSRAEARTFYEGTIHVHDSDASYSLFILDASKRA